MVGLSNKILSRHLSSTDSDLIIAESNDSVVASYINSNFGAETKYEFYGFDLLTEKEKISFYEALEESDGCVTASPNGREYMFSISQDDLPMIRKIIKHKKELKAGKLLLLIAVCMGIITNMKWLESILKNQEPAYFTDMEEPWSKYLFPFYSSIYQIPPEFRIDSYVTIDEARTTLESFAKILAFNQADDEAPVWEDFSNASPSFVKFNENDLENFRKTLTFASYASNREKFLNNEILGKFDKNLFFETLNTFRTFQIMPLVDELALERAGSDRFRDSFVQSSDYTFLLTVEESALRDNVLSETMSKTEKFEMWYLDAQVVSWLVAFKGEGALRDFLRFKKSKLGMTSHFSPYSFYMELVRYYFEGLDEKYDDLELGLRIEGIYTQN